LKPTDVVAVFDANSVDDGEGVTMTGSADAVRHPVR